jgi:hypothetical protein
METQATSTQQGVGIDFSQHAFIQTFEQQGNRYCATFCEEALPKDIGLKFTGRWNVTMVHPEQGLINFNLKQNGARWSPDLSGQQNKLQLEPEMVDWCTMAIQQRQRENK